MSNFSGLPACTHKELETPSDAENVIEFFRLKYPLDFCDGWRDLFSTTENLRQLLSEKGCVLETTCCYDPIYETQPRPCCRLCIFLGICDPESRIKVEYERRQPMGLDDVTEEIGEQGEHPLENVVLKQINVISPRPRLAGR